MALSYGNQVLLSFTSSFSITWNTLISIFYLKEQWVKEHLIYIGVIIAGSGSFLLVAHNEERQWKEGELFGLYFSSKSISFITFCLLYIIASYQFARMYKSGATRMYAECLGLP